MDHMKVLKRAWHILWHYKALWLFGFLLALTTASGNGGQANYRLGNNDFNGQGFNITPPGEVSAQLQQIGEAIARFFDRLFSQGVPTGVPQRLAAGAIALIVGLVCLGLLAAVVAAIIQLVSRTALIRMVDDHEETGAQLRVGRGFRLGWSRAAWRIFLINLVIGIPLAIVFIVLMAVTLLPLLAWTGRNVTLGVLGTIVTVAFFFLLICLMIIVAIAVSVLKRFFWRATALEDLGVFPAISRGYTLVRQNLKDVALMWLIVFGINIAWTILMIPLVLLFLAFGGVLGGAVLLVVRLLSGLVTSGAAPWIIGILLGAPVFLLFFAGPLAFVGGLRQTFLSTIWTLTFREGRALSDMEAAPEQDTGSDDASLALLQAAAEAEGGGDEPEGEEADTPAPPEVPVATSDAVEREDDEPAPSEAEDEA